MGASTPGMMSTVNEALLTVGGGEVFLVVKVSREVNALFIGGKGKIHLQQGDGPAAVPPQPNKSGQQSTLNNGAAESSGSGDIGRSTTSKLFCS